MVPAGFSGLGELRRLPLSIPIQYPGAGTSPPFPFPAQARGLFTQNDPLTSLSCAVKLKLPLVGPLSAKPSYPSTLSAVHWGPGWTEISTCAFSFLGGRTTSGMAYPRPATKHPINPPIGPLQLSSRLIKKFLTRIGTLPTMIATRFPPQGAALY